MKDSMKNNKRDNMKNDIKDNIKNNREDNIKNSMKESMKDNTKKFVFPSLLLMPLTLLTLLILLALLLFISACVPQHDKSWEGKAECGNNYDCVKIQTTCCPCNMGGKEACVPKLNVSAYKPKNCPKNPVCTAVYSCDTRSCVCQEGKCKAR